MEKEDRIKIKEFLEREVKFTKKERIIKERQKQNKT